MVKIESFGSSSAGNSYIISCDDSSLMLEAGIDPKKMNEVNWSIVKGCLITHEHGDHSKFANKLVQCVGFDIYSSAGTLEALSVASYRTKRLEADKVAKIDDWQVLPFLVEHDVSEPFGFLILAPDGSKIVFATDTYFVRKRFIGVTHFMIECNYALDILDQNVSAGHIDNGRRKRLLTSHFELGNVKNFLNSNDLSQVQETWLLHLSNQNSDEKRFKKEIQAITGTPVYIA
ncbi:MBL fold metallo-hydrolase [Carnobacterium divergens]|uniref:MBL fold metallo-hydrolase n=1 Tax=Carnobacterium divergens TaxID=2748 RepID=UPI001071AF05|nr:MBL fold metallo-hydrolase [Carnobacterium divergens]MDT1995192.1 MBL fold metallo-hydrolase [Carnobacterium divergens]TFI68791.1 MBL fold metallo-hydrolase [Carnobacterium divergens]TFI81263.1 MBL fold metallo-hydrolase [Carnobacterium divergens]TFI88755.1 MBL fold metallo-hydrolase [Carnobacterium divergens]TFI90126.1 MBL fold metallo-hydrolase [Carnobacterium divergens]